MTQLKAFILLLGLLISVPCFSSDAPVAWPEPTRESRPGAYWWWLGSAVDRTNITRELQRYHDAGMGAVHIIPIYGAKGWEQNYIPYLSPQWLEILRYTVLEANRLGLNVDMTTGTGWCFGGPTVTDLEANALAVVKTFSVSANGQLAEKVDPKTIQALMAFPAPTRRGQGRGESAGIDLAARIQADGTVNWSPESGSWVVYAVSQRPSGQKVKRSSPGGAGHMLNLFYPSGVTNYLHWFDNAFANYHGPWPRAMYHDSYEYRSDWAPDLFAQFEKRRGYRLQNELPALFGKEESERAARVKCDYRQTISEIMAEESLPAWANWCRAHGMRTRNQAHGSPGNLLDLYAAADIPETEMFHTDRNRLVSKVASSAAHVTGRPLVASETGTWLQEHFTETLADMKYLQDDLFLSGVNHIFYHGTCYSPDEAPWPGWLFYASYEMNPRNSIWRDVPALNAYATRCQTILQAGRPDNDLLLYWPIHDRWHNPKGLVQNFSVHARDWLEGQPVGKAAEFLWSRGYAFDYISDRQLQDATGTGSRIKVPGGEYRAIVVPACEHIPVETMRRLLALAQQGAAVLFEKDLPKDVPGWGQLEQRRADFQSLARSVKLATIPGKDVQESKLGQGRLLVGPLPGTLEVGGIQRESFADHPGLMFIRRAVDNGRYYFIANRGDKPLAGWVPLAYAAKSVAILDPLSGGLGLGAIRQGQLGRTEVQLVLPPGGSIILKTSSQELTGPAWAWAWAQPSGEPTPIAGEWDIKFLQGGPQLPAPLQTTKLASWTELSGEDAQRFAGTALYSISFNAPAGGGKQWFLDLGNICQSARVRLNGRELGTLFVPPYRVLAGTLLPKDNRLEVEVTNVSANRIRDLDRRKVAWKVFNDINIVNIGYKPFDASNWPLTDSGLLGPVTLIPAGPMQ